MTIIVNPGSRIGDDASADGWTNTYQTAQRRAEDWLAKMRQQGIGDVDIVRSDPTPVDGRWTFVFRHSVTGVEVELEIHGIDDLAAYRRQHIFDPRVYWGGSSSSNPSLEDFGKAGYVMTFRRGGGAS